MTSSNLVSVQEACEILHVNSNDTVYALIRSGDIKAFKVGKGGKTSKWRIHENSLRDYISRCTKQAPCQDVKSL